MYACSPKWKDDWISEKDAEKILTQLSDKLRGKYPQGFNGIGVNYGIHFTGGEPFLNFELLVKVTKIAHELAIPSTFVETNCFWCRDDKTTEEKLIQLRDRGLEGILVSANPFIVEQVPFERIERGFKVSREVFGENVIVYHELFFHQLKELGIEQTLSFDEYLSRMREKDPVGLYQALSFPSVLPMGRAPYKLGYLYKKYPARQFFGESCKEELTRPWHVHIDNYGNYMTGYCGGISLGDTRELDTIREINLDERPILGALVTDLEKLYEIGKKFGYEEQREGYISKCHLCLDIRKHIVQQTDEFEELRPREFYLHL
jgi:hypothetical protein